MGAEGSKSNPGRTIPGVARDQIVARWKKRILSTQLFAVARHDERADGIFVRTAGPRWTQTDDYLKWPLDPPISDAGIEAAGETGQRVMDLSKSSGCQIHVVISSPYYRCIQTAVEICRRLGSKTKLLIDQSLGEIFGPSVMGSSRPKCPVRPIGHTHAYCVMNGVPAHPEVIGRWPEWPESVTDARRRYSTRFLTYLHRSTVTRRNFLLVSHADCVAVALSVMPSQADNAVQSVEYGGLFLARRQCRDHTRKSWSSSGGVSSSKGLNSIMPSNDPPDAIGTSQYEPLAPLPDDDLEEPEHKQLYSWGASDPSSGSATCDFDQMRTAMKKIGSAGSTNSAGSCGATGSAKAENLPNLPCATDGWHVFIHGIELRKKTSACVSTRRDKFIKKVVALTKGSKFHRNHIEQLLGELSDEPLGFQQGECASASTCSEGHEADFGIWVSK